MITLGVDLASKDRNTACCIVRWRDGLATLEALDTRLSNAVLLKHMDEAEIVGVDALFGWRSTSGRRLARGPSEVAGHSLGRTPS